MGLDDIAKWIRGEWAVIAQAPVTFLAAVFLLGFVIWRAIQWQHGSIIGHRDAEIASLKRQIESTKIDESARLARPGEPISAEPPFVAEHQSSTNSAKPPKVFVESVATPAFLMDLCSDKTTVQAQKAVEPYIRKWLKITGKVKNVAPTKYSYIVSLNYDKSKMRIVWLFFRENTNLLDAFSIGDEITVIGWIESVKEFEVNLEDAELA